MKPLVIGHRGASGYRPEHTRSAYELAVALGADAVEPDIVATRDGVLVLRHENEISGTTDVAERAEFASRRTTREVDGQRLTGWFTEDFTWAELATLRARERIGAIRASSATFDGRFPILRLADLFELLDTASEERGSGVGMVAEIKHATHFAEAGLPLDELFAAEAAAAGWALDDDRVTFEAFELDVLDRLGARSAGSRRVFLLEDAGAPFDQVRARGADALPYAQYLTPAGLDSLVGRVDGISIPKNLVLATSGPGLIDEAHARDLAVFTWTLRPENRFLAAEHRRGRDKAAFGDWPTEFAAILGAGVDGIFVDHPDLGVEARASFIG